MISENEYEKFCHKRQSLIYPTDEIPENYFLNNWVLINDIFYGVFEEGRSVSDAIKDSEMFHGMSLDYIKDKMIEENLIEEKLDMDSFDEEISKFTNKKLKKILKKNNIEIPKNNKNLKDLIKKEIPEKIVKTELSVTDKGIEYREKTAHKIDLFDDCCMENSYYQEFYDLCIKNPDKSDEDNLLDFMDQHIELAIERKDHCTLIHFYENKGYFYNVHMDYLEKGLDEVLKQFSISVNPIYLPEKYYKDYEVVNKYINQNILELSNRLSAEFIKTRFDYIWDSFEFEKEFITKQEALTYLEKMMENRDAYKKINETYSIK